MLGKPFGERKYVLTVLRDVEDEVKRNSALRSKFPWFNEVDLKTERLATQVRLSADEHRKLNSATSVLRGHVLQDVDRYTRNDRSPPSEVDCRVLAFGQIRDAIVVTDDLGMHLLASDFEIPIWHGPELLAKLRTHKIAANDVVRKIYAALEANGDLTATWIAAKHTTFIKVFGKAPP
jgi:hypothetical protein